MKNAILNKKPPTLKTLANEVSLLRSFLIGHAGQDTERVYLPEFVEDLLRISANAVAINLIRHT